MGIACAQFIDHQLGSKFTAPITDTIMEVYQDWMNLLKKHGKHLSGWMNFYEYMVLKSARAEVHWNEGEMEF